MASSEEIPNIEPFPIPPRVINRAQTPPPASRPEEPSRRSLTPVHKGKVEFWHPGEQPGPVEKLAKTISYPHARRADHIGILMAVMALLFIVLVAVALRLNNRKYSFESSSPSKTTAPVVDFYQGNQAFNQKVREEKTGLTAPDLPVHGANGDMEISLQAQMASMNEKLERMRSQKLIEEPPIPEPDKGVRPVPVIGVRPTEIQKFNSPLEFNGMLPKSLREAK